MSDAGGDLLARQRKRLIEALGAIVEVWQQVAMAVNQHDGGCLLALDVLSSGLVVAVFGGGAVAAVPVASAVAVVSAVAIAIAVAVAIAIAAVA